MMRRLVIVLALLVWTAAARAQTTTSTSSSTTSTTSTTIGITLPSQSRAGILSLGQTTTGPSVGVDTRAGFQTAVFTYILNSGTSATVQTEVNCEPVTANQPANPYWVLVANSSQALTTAANVASVGLSYPDCSYRTNVTACSACNVTTKYKLGVQLK